MGIFDIFRRKSLSEETISLVQRLANDPQKNYFILKAFDSKKLNSIIKYLDKNPEGGNWSELRDAAKKAFESAKSEEELQEIRRSYGYKDVKDTDMKQILEEEKTLRQTIAKEEEGEKIKETEKAMESSARLFEQADEEAKKAVEEINKEEKTAEEIEKKIEVSKEQIQKSEKELAEIKLKALKDIGKLEKEEINKEEKVQKKTLEVLKETIDLLKRNNIDYWVAAGYAVEGFLNPQNELRKHDDIDILILEKDQNKLVSLLEKNGFNPKAEPFKTIKASINNIKADFGVLKESPEKYNLETNLLKMSIPKEIFKNQHKGRIGTFEFNIVPSELVYFGALHSQKGDEKYLAKIEEKFNKELFQKIIVDEKKEEIREKEIEKAVEEVTKKEEKIGEEIVTGTAGAVVAGKILSEKGIEGTGQFFQREAKEAGYEGYGRGEEVKKETSEEEKKFVPFGSLLNNEKASFFGGKKPSFISRFIEKRKIESKEKKLNEQWNKEVPTEVQGFVNQMVFKLAEFWGIPKEEFINKMPKVIMSQSEMKGFLREKQGFSKYYLPEEGEREIDFVLDKPCYLKKYNIIYFPSDRFPSDYEYKDWKETIAEQAGNFIAYWSNQNRLINDAQFFSSVSRIFFGELVTRSFKKHYEEQNVKYSKGDIEDLMEKLEKIDRVKQLKEIEKEIYWVTAPDANPDPDWRKEELERLNSEKKRIEEEIRSGIENVEKKEILEKAQHEYDVTRAYEKAAYFLFSSIRDMIPQKRNELLKMSNLQLMNLVYKGMLQGQKNEREIERREKAKQKVKLEEIKNKIEEKKQIKKTLKEAEKKYPESKEFYEKIEEERKQKEISTAEKVVAGAAGAVVAGKILSDKGLEGTGEFFEREAKEAGFEGYGRGGEVKQIEKIEQTPSLKETFQLKCQICGQIFNSEGELYGHSCVEKGSKATPVATTELRPELKLDEQRGLEMQIESQGFVNQLTLKLAEWWGIPTNNVIGKIPKIEVVTDAKYDEYVKQGKYEEYLKGRAFFLPSENKIIFPLKYFEKPYGFHGWKAVLGEEVGHFIEGFVESRPIQQREFFGSVSRLFIAECEPGTFKEDYRKYLRLGSHYKTTVKGLVEKEREMRERIATLPQNEDIPEERRNELLNTYNQERRDILDNLEHIFQYPAAYLFFKIRDMTPAERHNLLADSIASNFLIQEGIIELGELKQKVEGRMDRNIPQKRYKAYVELSKLVPELEMLRKEAEQKGYSPERVERIQNLMLEIRKRKFQPEDFERLKELTRGEITKGIEGSGEFFEREAKEAGYEGWGRTASLASKIIEPITQKENLPNIPQGFTSQLGLKLAGLVGKGIFNKFTRRQQTENIPASEEQYAVSGSEETGESVESESVSEYEEPTGEYEAEEYPESEQPVEESAMETGEGYEEPTEEEQPQIVIDVPGKISKKLAKKLKSISIDIPEK